MLDKNPKSALWPSFGVAGHSMSFYAVCALLVLSLVARGTLAADTRRLHHGSDVTNNPRSEAVMMVFEQAMKLPIGERESLVSRLMQANDAEPLTDVELAAHDEAWAQTVPWSEVRGDHEYICEVRYGGASANALQRGLWTNTKNGLLLKQTAGITK